MDVFISYNSADRRYADDVKSGLEKNGVSCWIAPECIPGGADYADSIPKAIDRCKVFVLILTENAQKSVYVLKELDRAVNKKKIIIPYMLTECELTNSFSYLLSNVQRKDNLNTVVADVCNAVDKNIVAELMLKKFMEFFGDKINEQSGSADIVDDKNEDAVKKEWEEEYDGSLNYAKEKSILEKIKKRSKGSKVFTSIIMVCSFVLFFLVGWIYYEGSSVEIAGDRYFIYTTFNLELKQKIISYSDLESISKLKLLNSLKLDNCVFDINFARPKVKLSRVSSLTVVNSSIEGFLSCVGDLKDNTSITALDVSGCAGLDDMDLESFFPSGLVSLNISKTRISDISFVQSLTLLSSFTARENGITDISKLTSLEDLTYLDISDNNIESLKGIEYCVRLSVIYAQNNSISSLDPLSNATRLTNVNLKNNKITNISPLAKSAQTLNNVCLDSNNISDMSALAGAENIDSLSFANNAVTSIEFVKNMKNLTQINASNNKITDVTVLTELTNLNRVFIRSNGITGSLSITLKGVAPMLDVGDNPITDIHISADSVMEFLNISATDIKNVNASGKIGLGTTVAVTYNDMFDFDAINKAATVKIVDCPLDKRVDMEEKLSCKPEFTDIADVTEYSDSLADKIFTSGAE